MDCKGLCMMKERIIEQLDKLSDDKLRLVLIFLYNF